MKKILPFLLLTALISCSKSGQDINQDIPTIQATPVIPSGYAVPSCIIPKETDFLAGQTINTGNITIWNDETNVYVHYQVTGGYRLKKTHLYVGAENMIPTNNAGNPRIGQYPRQTDHGTPGVSGYTYVIPRSSLNSGSTGCLWISAHAEVGGTDPSGQSFSQTGWAAGPQVNDGGSWAMKYAYCIDECADGGGEQPR